MANVFAWKDLYTFEEKFWSEFFKVWGIYIIASLIVQLIHISVLGGLKIRIILWLFNLFVLISAAVAHFIIFGLFLKLAGASFKDGFYPQYGYVFMGLICWVYLLIAGLIGTSYSLDNLLTWTLGFIGLVIGIIITLKITHKNLKNLTLPIVGAILGWFTGFGVIRLILFIFRNVTITYPIW